MKSTCNCGSGPSPHGSPCGSLLNQGHSPSFATDRAGSEQQQSVLYVVTGLGWGGAESQVIDLAIEFRSRGWGIGVACLLASAERREALERNDVPVHTLGMVNGVPDPRAIWRLSRVIRAMKPFVVHSHMVHANILARVTRLVASMPVLISTGHNIDEGPGWRTLAYRATDRLADLTTHVSHAAVAQAVLRRAVPVSRIRFVPNGVDLERFHRDNKRRERTRHELNLFRRFTWIIVGRFTPQKDYANLMQALSYVARSGRDFILLAVGDGPLLEQMKSGATELGVEQRVRFLGIREDVPDLLNAADAFVSSSAWEGLPISLIEAAAMGLPIVATNVGGNAQIVKPPHTGLLAPPRDSIALSSGMLHLMGLPTNILRVMGIRGAEHARRTFGLREVANQWEQIYGELGE